MEVAVEKNPKSSSHPSGPNYRWGNGLPYPRFTEREIHVTRHTCFSQHFSGPAFLKEGQGYGRSSLIKPAVSPSRALGCVHLLNYTLQLAETSLWPRGFIHRSCLSLSAQSLEASSVGFLLAASACVLFSPSEPGRKPAKGRALSLLTAPPTHHHPTGHHSWLSPELVSPCPQSFNEDIDSISCGFQKDGMFPFLARKSKG